MAKPTVKTKLFAALAAGGAIVLVLGVVVALLWSAVASTVRGNREAAAQYAETQRVQRVEIQKEAARRVPLATIGGAPATPPVGASPVAPQSKPVVKVAPIPLATVGDPSDAGKKPPVPLAKPAPINSRDAVASAQPKPSVETAKLSQASSAKPERIPLATVSSEDAPAVSGPRDAVALAPSPTPSPTASVPPANVTPKAAAEPKPSVETAKLPSQASSGKSERIALATVSPRETPAIPSKPAPPAKPAATESPELLQPITLSETAKTKGAAELASVPSTRPTQAAGLATVTLDKIKKQMPPPLEEQREEEEKLLTADQDTVKIVTGFECSTPLWIEKISPTHFAVTITTESELKNWFMFRVEGAKGKTVRIDIKDAPWGKWWSLNPVYSDIASLDDPTDFRSTPLTEPRKMTAAYNGPLIPQTSDQKWHYIPDVWNEPAKDSGLLVRTYCFVHRYDSDAAFVAMKTPYTVKYNEAFLESLKNQPDVSLVEVGRSPQGRPVRLLRIGAGDPKQTPCIVLYAREHGSEHDSSWVAQGMIEYLLREGDEAKRLREQFTFLIIPMLDPDAVAAGKYENIIKHFVYAGKSGPESLAIADYFRKWVEAGNRLDIVYNIHNVESAENGHIMSVVKDRGPERGPAGWTLDEDFLRPLTRNTVYQMDPRNRVQGELARFRLGGYLGFFYGPLHMPYEVNSQEKLRHLTLSELKAIGPLLVESGTKFIVSDASKPLRDVIAEMRRRRDVRVAHFSHLFRNLDNALQVEWISYEKHVASLQGVKLP